MQLTSAEQGLLLAGTLGFVTCVALLHLGEAAMLAAKLRAWMPLLWSGMLLLAAVILLVWRIGVDISHGVRFSDLVLIFGGQLGLLICLPSRWLLRRKCTWERTRAQRDLQVEWWRQAQAQAQAQAHQAQTSDPRHPYSPYSPQFPQHLQQRPPLIFRGSFDHLDHLDQLDARRAGVGPRGR